MSSEEEGPKPSPTETTDTTSVVSDDDEERLLKEDDEGGETAARNLQQQLEATSSSDTSANHSKSASQTRFSFYDAQEVQSKFVSTIPPKEQQRKEEESNKQRQLYRYNFYDPASLPPGDANNPIKINIASMNSATEVVQQQPANQGPASTSQRYEPPRRPQPLFPREGLSPTAMPHVSSQNSLNVNINTGSNNTSQHSHTDDILRSLQETEEQRMQILQPAATSVLLSAPPHVAGTTAALTTSSVLSTGSAHNRTSSLHGPSTATSNANSNDNNNNPYEDAIREALDLLRKHRSPPPSPSMNAIVASNAAAMTTTTATATATPLGDWSMPPQPRRTTPTATAAAVPEEYGATTTDDSQRIATTPANANGNATAVDTISTSDSLTDALQEAKLKAKQRQERMAEYASRLQEFKSSLPPEQQQSEQPEGTQFSYDNQQQQAPLSSPTSSSQLQPTSSILNDAESVGIISDISASTSALPPTAWKTSSSATAQPLAQQQQHQQRVVDEEVQKGVEKVLMAILEASKSGTSSNHSHVQQQQPDHPSGGESVVDTASTHSGVSEVLLKAMDEVLYGKQQQQQQQNSNANSVVPTSMSGISKYSARSEGTNRSKRSGGERSVVDDLLAEADEHPPSSSPQYWPREEKKMTENDPVVAASAALGTGKTKTVFSDTTNNIKVTKDESEKDIDAMIEESLRESNRDEDGASEEEMVSEEFQVEEDEDLNSDYDEEGSYNDDEENDGSDQDEDDGGDANGTQPKRVLGPLSRNAGGTTGVVLDAASNSNPASPDVGKESKGYFSSVVKYVTSALTPDRQRIMDNQKAEVQPQESDDSEDKSTDDVEATELMRTLCAHLLPYGVDRQSNLEDVVPAWDEENPNEAGYRIIRLSKSQLRRVERAFDKMINGLKYKSQSKLSLGEGEYDANFIRELQEAERLLDDEENRNQTVEIVKGARKSTPSPPNPTAIIAESESVIGDSDKLSTPTHPDFPGIKTAGKGEMGDLEFFHLPIIFKSHVTGFEPTKDMVLEPGNVVAGQYLVESELGSAAFSTAYRCIDMSSEDKDGHEEVCLKVIKNTKDFFDQSLDEIKILELLRQTGQCDENYIIRMKTFFYYREHLIIVTELLRQNLFEFGKFIIDNDEEPYFTIPRLAYITRQCLIALRFVHNLGLVHSDIKPENILLGSYSRAKIKLIDFGSSCYLTDRQSSYIQSRSYRAPEVVLGLPYDGKIDVWSLGCVVAEMYTGEVTFQNDSIVSMLSRIEAICGSFPRHMIAQGRQSGRFFTKSGLLYEVVDDSDNDSTKNTPPGPNDDESDSETDTPIHYDIFQPKNTRLSSRLGFEGDLMDDYENNSYSGSGSVPDHELEQLFTDFISRLLTIDPDGRPNADEALQHPWMLYAAKLTEADIKYP